MIRMAELLESPIYRKWVEKPPRLRSIGNGYPWRLFVQKEQNGIWAIKEFAEYEEGINIIFAKATEFYDMALVSRRQVFKPPTIVKGDKRYKWVIPPGHLWCGYCRRPTKFMFFTSHHAFPMRYKGLIDPTQKRCSICGIRQKALGYK